MIEFIPSIRISEDYSYHKKKKEILNNISLDDPKNIKTIYKNIPRTFEIITDNGSCYFNLELLEDISATIRLILRNNKETKKINLSISNNEILKKIEEICQGEVVTIKKKEANECRNIIELLRIDRFPYQILDRKSYNNGITIYSVSNKFFKKNSKTFKIITKKNEYICNFFGVFSSKVLKDFLNENPNADSYQYDCDDEFKEFQKICNFFNFKEVLITKDDLDFFQKVSEDLKIDIIMKKVDQIINSQDQISDKIDDSQNLIDSIEELFELLYSINANTIENVKNSILNSFWSKTEEDVQELAAFILQVIESNPQLHESILELLIQLDMEDFNEIKILLPFIKRKIMDSLPNENNFCPFLYKLYSKKIVSRDELYSILNKSDEYKKLPCQVQEWFLPELIEINKYDEFYIWKSSLKQFYPDNMDLYKKLRASCEPEDELSRALKNDDVDTFQSFIIMSNLQNVSKCYIVPSIFEPINSIDNNNHISYLNYSAAYGSIKCFKFLMLNHSNIDSSTFYYSIFGGNNEIIKIVDNYLKQNNSKMIYNNINENDDDDYDYYEHYEHYEHDEDSPVNENVLMNLITNHKYNLFDWILEQGIEQFKFSDFSINFIVDLCIQNGNIHAFIALMDLVDLSNQSKIFEIAAKKGFYRFLHILFNIRERCVKTFSRLGSNVNAYVSFGNLNIFKLFIKTCEDFNEIDNILICAIIADQMKMINYFLDEESHRITDDIILSLLTNSLAKSDELFYFLIDKFKEKAPSAFDKFQWDSVLLETACKYGRLKPFYTIIDSIKSLKTINFSICVSNAAIYGSKEILDYLIDHKFDINYMNAFSSIAFANNVDREIILYLFNKSGTEFSISDFLQFMHIAIKSHNKNFVEFLCERNVFYDDLLIDSVRTNDINIVNSVLKYKSDPTFVNRLSPSGTSLHIAVQINCLDIVKRLLSIPGINPNLCDFNNFTPLMIAVKEMNVLVIKEFISFYGKNFFSNNKKAFEFIFKSASNISNDYELFCTNLQCNQPQVLEVILNIENIHLFFVGNNMKYFEQLFKTKINIEIIKKLLQIESIDINSCLSGNTPLIYSIQSKRYDLVDLLIKDPRIDINKTNSRGESPLFYAIKDNNLPFVKQLLSFPNINVYSYDTNGNTPFMDDLDAPTIKEFLLYCHKNNQLHKETMEFVLNKIINKDYLLLKNGKYNTVNYNLWNNNSDDNSEEYNNPKDEEENVNTILDIFFSIPNIESIFDQQNQNIFLDICSVDDIDIKFIQLFLKYESTNVNFCSPSNGNTPLMSAIIKNRFDIAQLLINDPRTDINITNFYHDSALIIATIGKQEFIVELLINDKRFDPNISDACYAFEISENDAITNLLLSKNLFDINSSALWHSNSSNNPYDSSYYNNYINYNNNNNNNYYNNDNNNIYCSYYNKGAFSFELNKKVDLPLLFAAKKSDLKKFELILRHPKFDKDKSCLQKAIEILLHMKSEKETNELFKIICRNGLIEEVIANEKQFNDLMNVINRENLEYLLNEENSIKIGILQLFTFSLNSSLDMIKMIIEYDQQHDNLIDFMKTQFLTKIKISKDVEQIVIYVLENGGDINKPDEKGIYPLQQAIIMMNLEFVQALINTKLIDFNQKIIKINPFQFFYQNEDKQYETYLHLAAKVHKEIFLVILNESKLDINVKDSENETPLMAACSCFNQKVIKILFKNDNLDFHCKNIRNKDALNMLKTTLGIDEIESNDELSNNQYLDRLLSIIGKHQLHVLETNSAWE